MILFISDGAAVTRIDFGPPQGVSPRAVLHLALYNGYAWATIPVDEREYFTVLWESSTRLLQVQQESQLTGEDEGASKSLVFDSASLSWKLGDKSEQARTGTPGRAAAPSSSFLPRFSLGRRGSQAGSETESNRGVTVSARGKGDGPRTAASRDQGGAAGIAALQDALAQRRLRIDDSDGGCNVFLAMARLLNLAGVEMQGLMLTSVEGGNEGSIIGAMSRKARADTKAYIQEHAQDFDKPGQWLGDHDLAAAARLYRIRIVFLMVIYSREVKEHVYEPDRGYAPQRTVHLCLDRGLFWPLVPETDSPSDAAPRPSADSPPDESEGAGAREARYVEPADRRRASALDKVLHKFGGGRTASAEAQARSGGGAESESRARGVSRLDAEREWMAGLRFGEPVVVKSKLPCTAAVIVLHGLGSSGAEWEQLAAAMRLPWIRFVLPTACMRHVAVARDVMPSWFDVSAGALLAQVPPPAALPGV